MCSVIQERYCASSCVCVAHITSGIVCIICGNTITHTHVGKVLIRREQILKLVHFKIINECTLIAGTSSITWPLNFSLCLVFESSRMIISPRKGTFLREIILHFLLLYIQDVNPYVIFNRLLLQVLGSTLLIHRTLHIIKKNFYKRTGTFPG